MSVQRGFAMGPVLFLLACQSATDLVGGDLTVSDLTLPTAIRDFRYSATLAPAASGGDAAYSWRLSRGSVPDGLTLNESGTVGGIPTKNGTFTFDAEVRSGGSAPQTGRFEVSVIDALSLAVSTELDSASYRDSQWRCEFVWTVTAVGGRPTDRAYWQASDVAFYRASNGARTVSPISTEELVDWFGEDQVSFEEVMSIPFYLAWDGPFEATINLRYSVTPSFAHSTASADIDCR